MHVHKIDIRIGIFIDREIGNTEKRVKSENKF